MSAVELNTFTESDNHTELSDQDYPQVGGYTSSRNTSAGSTTPTTAESVDLDKKQVVSILNREGYGISAQHVNHLNTFPSPMNAFQYALYEFGITDMFFVVMINKRKNSIYGYHILDLTQEYSLADDLVTRMKSQTNF